VSELRKVEVCMAPSVVLTRPDASRMGFLVEQVILRDYLRDTSRTPPPPYERLVPTTEDWWDVADVGIYKALLLKRHLPGIDARKLQDLKTLRVPDISTWKGGYLRRDQVGIVAVTGRSELYEIKPDTVWGEAAGVEKLRDINQNFADLAIRGYTFGSWYPTPPGPLAVASKQLPFGHFGYVMAGLDYRLRRMESSLKNIGLTLVVRNAVVEIERRQPGLIYYMICVHMSLDFNGEERVAKKVVQRLFEALTSGLSKEQAKIERDFANALSPAGRDRKPRMPTPPDKTTQEAIRAIEAEESFSIRAVDLVEELRDSVASLGQVLFTRLRGLPGERFLVCADQVYFDNEIMARRRMQVENQIRVLQVRPPLIVEYHVARSLPMVKVSTIFIASAVVLYRLLQARPYGAAEEWRKAVAWLEANPALTLLIGCAVVFGTAVVLASAGTAGALLLYGSGAAAAGGTAVGAGITEGGMLAAGSGLARGLASRGLAEYALPEVEAIGYRFSVEAARRAAMIEADALLTRQLAARAEQQAERIIARKAAKLLREELAQTALLAGGPTIAALAINMALPHVGPGAAVDEQAAATATPLATEIGSLHLLKLKDNVHIRDLPPTLNEIDYTKFSFEAPGPALRLPEQMGGPSAKRGKLWHLGVLECL
jgi:hypothetical protein